MAEQEQQQKAESNYTPYDAVTFIILTPLFLTASWYLVTINPLYGILLALSIIPLSIIAVRDKKGITKITIMIFILFFFWNQFLPRYLWTLKIEKLNLLTEKLDYFAYEINTRDELPKYYERLDDLRGKYDSMMRRISGGEQYDIFDPFSKTSRHLMYYEDGKNWLLWSAGPDQDYDMPSNWIRNRFYYFENENLNWLINNTYDPTNGSLSSGDLWRSNLIE